MCKLQQLRVMIKCVILFLCFIHTLFLFTLADKPLPPTDLNVKEIFADHCTLTWKPPTDDGGGDITGLYIEFLAYLKAFLYAS